jgi:ubiquitin-protein ligase E3 C
MLRLDLYIGGSRVPVTSQNRGRYIDEVAKYYLHDRIRIQSQAFFEGLYQVIQPDLLCVFSAPELQVMISGVSGGIDIEDLRRNSRYAGGYLPMDTHTSRFWQLLAELEDADRARLLRFVTSCERAPSLGFAALQPPFTIQRVDCNDDARLPSASTCFNILKLPTYSSKKIMRDRLLTAIRSNAGFDLS